MQHFKLSEAAQMMNAFISGGADSNTLVQEVCTDSRQAKEGSLFFALKGDNSDGYIFAEGALNAGAAAVVVDRPVERTTRAQIVVPDPLKALGELARQYRNHFTIPIIGLTGSVGKTSTRDMLATALRARLNVLTSEKNFNNEIGLPLTLLRLDRSHEVAVLEMGMRGAGQIAELCEIARPDIGLITNVGMSHIELLGSREAVARAKGELIEGLPADGVVILPSDDDYIDLLSDLAESRQIRTFGLKEEADYRATDITFDTGGASRFRINGIQFQIHTPGVHHIINACAACAAAAEMGIPMSEVALQLDTFRAPAMRMEALELGSGITLINDAYNAAPDSMRSALDTLSMVSGGRRTVAILGDMRELGDWSEESHRFVGETAASRRVDLLITVGQLAQQIGDSGRKSLSESQIVSYPDTPSAIEGVLSILKPGDIVLVKGSRAMAMEKLVEAIQEGFSPV